MKEINFGQKFEPREGKILHGAGQSPERFLDYWNAVKDFKPSVYMEYVRVDEIREKFDKKMKKMLKVSKDLMPQIGLNFKTRINGAQCKEVAEGIYDKDIFSMIKILKEIRNPSFIRIGYEFDKKGKYDSKEFVNAWKHIVDLIRDQGVENIATVWCACPYNGTSSVEPYYPGDDYVDWFGVDVFSARFFKDSKYKPVQDFLTLATKHKKPVMVGESSAIKTPKEKMWEKWFKPYFKWIDSNPVIKAFCYINWNCGVDWKQPEWGNSRIDNKKEVMEKYIKELSKLIYIHNGVLIK
ncbi:MAG: glycosyl hydrolase [Nanoarchaeota archaeon]